MTFRIVGWQPISEKSKEIKMKIIKKAAGQHSVN